MPEPSRGEVRVRVRAAGVNRADLLQRMGMYPAPPGAPPDIPGLEFAGEVEALGSDAKEWKIGDRVMGLVAGGAYAEFVVLHERMLARAPSEMSFREAAAIPEAFLTAYDAFEQANLRAGEIVLVHAAGSGVGTAAIQIARSIGAIPIGTARTADKLERAKAFGLVRGVVAKDGEFASAVGKSCIDVVLELVGGTYVTEDLECIALRGRIVLVGLMAGPAATLPLPILLQKRVTIIGTTLRARPLEEKIRAALLLRRLVPLFEKAILRPIVDRSYPLEHAAKSHDDLAGNSTFGKIVLEV